MNKDKFARLFGLILCVIAIETGVSKWNDCPVDQGSIPLAMMLAGLSGLLFILPGYFRMTRPEIQFTLAIYNSANLIKNLNNLFTLNSSPSCSHQMLLATILCNVIVFACWFHRMITLITFMANRSATKTSQKAADQ